MKKVTIVIISIIFCSTFAQGQKDKQFYADLTTASHSIWHGWDINNNNSPVIHPYLEYAIPKSGFSLAAWASLPTDRSLNINDDIEFFLKYNKELLGKKQFAIKFNSFIDYVVCPNVKLTTTDGSNKTKMLWKYNLGIAFTNLIKIAQSRVIPAYNLYYIRPFGNIDFTDGSIHECSLFYTIPVLSRIKVGSTVNYHTGVFDGGSGWTHATSHISSSLNVKTVKLSAAINKQWSFNQRSDIEDEFWFSLGISSKF
ncbi:hypothetical protein [Sunxiuqinia sp. sy24]|uniref:hypothetical protein n=1 Tax=Sunxiuqinia sp. sy24 TaxID=3461495 RepID=UPI0040462379